MAEKKVVMVRMSPEEHEVLKIFSFHTRTSINEIMLRAMKQFLATEGRSKELDALLRNARNRYRNALDKLEDD